MNGECWKGIDMLREKTNFLLCILTFYYISISSSHLFLYTACSYTYNTYYFLFSRSSDRLILAKTDLLQRPCWKLLCSLLSKCTSIWKQRNYRKIILIYNKQQHGGLNFNINILIIFLNDVMNIVNDLQ